MHERASESCLAGGKHRATARNRGVIHCASGDDATFPKTGGRGGSRSITRKARVLVLRHSFNEQAGWKSGVESLCMQVEK